ncbi:MAG: hypothetical protein U9Q90_08375 [Campylobacterota bacterium]|nr:hypothetical protein [Campylobacterota bacterium]
MKNFKLTDENMENLKVFKGLLGKDENTMINEALKLYFIEESEKLQDIDSSQTNLSYAEFWDDVDI